MSETSAISQADGAEEQSPEAKPTLTALDLLNQAIFDFGAASLNHDVAHDAWDAACDTRNATKNKMKALYEQFQAETRGGK